MNGLQSQKYLLSGSLQEKIVHLCSNEKNVNLKFSKPKRINLRIFIQVGFYFAKSSSCGNSYYFEPVLFSDKRLLTS